MRVETVSCMECISYLAQAGHTGLIVLWVSCCLNPFHGMLCCHLLQIQHSRLHPLRAQSWLLKQLKAETSFRLGTETSHHRPSSGDAMIFACGCMPQQPSCDHIILRQIGKVCQSLFWAVLAVQRHLLTSYMIFTGRSPAQDPIHHQL